ncbi:HpcH/HpaI aldolase family protein [Bordetella hinzii]|uniref:HpcH/HpaI aldolase family protein n=1 Tax=Bordetella hinzii TaxID=103855 RepID=UPI0004596698|nr:aldolase/citrate lyase family protein [Bordetella hinzii]KCB49495.1 HpcH/HpaI aldolase/citrate lyase family protein [Bordetella hinzii 4161]KXA74269.1 4-hydroxy-2-oxovalerate aldolase [Bordetella hinzii LMG 13501]MCJ9707789.1 aldolase/citrate lyase family protein [Bordetella hinzii]QDJ36048.1 4-hydroxy-2-oxovalerate aldolase [Bordetella hinzii]QII83892.1 4-hydroxy-2-oxovalerate aldolase [Bordetella hinzii]
MSDSRFPLDGRLPDMLRSGKPLRGVFNGLPSPAIVEMCAYAGFDFIILDNEHGSADLGMTEHMLRAARAAGIVPVVRCFEHDLPRILDMGASAVQVPMVESAEQARRLAGMIRYPPLGRRGSAFSTRAAGYGAFGGAGHTQRSNEGIGFIAMIETPEAIAAAGEIAAVDGVDAVFIGPNDLAHAMGHGSDWNAAPVQRAIEQGLRAVAAAGKCAGIIALTPQDEEKYGAMGARYFANVSTSIITRALAQAASAGRDAPLRY